jgi:CRP-like cAMP-binding protein
MEQEVMAELPPSLQNLVSAHINEEMINSVPFLCRCDNATKQRIVYILRPRVFMPTDTIVQEGEQGFEMYFLKRGRVVVTSSSVCAPLRILSTNDFVGESCLLASSFSSATVKAYNKTIANPLV